jgi:hypothetical protein
VAPIHFATPSKRRTGLDFGEPIEELAVSLFARQGRVRFKIEGKRPNQKLDGIVYKALK